MFGEILLSRLQILSKRSLTFVDCWDSVDNDFLDLLVARFQPLAMSCRWDQLRTVLLADLRLLSTPYSSHAPRLLASARCMGKDG